MLSYRVVAKVFGGDAVERRVTQHADVEVRVGKPLHGLVEVLDRACGRKQSRKRPSARWGGGHRMCIACTIGLVKAAYDALGTSKKKKE